MPGVAGGGAWLVRGERGSLVAKHPVSATELRVYTRLAGVLLDAGVRLPRVLGHGTGVDAHWLLLEYLPAPLSGETVAPETLDQLVRIHRLARRERLPVLAGAEHPFRRPQGMARAAVAAFAKDVREGLEPRFEAVAAAARALFRRRGLVHGDTNRTNWRLDAQGLPTLVDWARTGYGHPALDPAPLLSGLPDRGRAAGLAHAYLARRPELERGRQGPLANAILLAKAYTAIEFLASAATTSDTMADEATRMWTAGLPAWLALLGV